MGSLSGGMARALGVGLLLGHPRKPYPVVAYATCCAWGGGEEGVQGRGRGPTANAWSSHESPAQCRELVSHSNRV